MSIRFGTDGWRAVIAETFTFSNLRLVAQAVADYIRKELAVNHTQPEVVIGYDTRFLSDRFAAEVARVMAGNGIIAWLSRTDAPTPAISYQIKAKQAVAGVMLTASHNPPRYNGFKLKADYGGSASPEACARVEHYLERLQNEVRGPNMIDLQHGLDTEVIRRFDPSWSYYGHLSTLVDLDIISNGELRVIADPMFGSGRGALREILGRSRCHVREIRGYMNPGFEGIHPEPIRHHLDLMAAAIQQDHADVGIATDGDADRIGAMDSQGNFVDPHQIMSLALQYLVEKRGLKGDVVKTVSTTAMINRIAKKHGLTVHETPVGFNHIADHMLNGDVLIGGEESGGISIRNHIPEGDGVLMGLLLLEIMGEAGRSTPLHEIISQLQKDYGPAIYERSDVRIKKPVDKKEMVKRLTDATPAYMAGQTLRDVQTHDGVKFVLEDESWLLIRPSGTEPVLRFYAEATSEDAVREMLEKGLELAGVNT
jgi:alpha-D-glucose phosphate-specific phosphoglucomutase